MRLPSSLLAAAVLFFAPLEIFAANKTVDSIASLQIALKEAVAGDVLTLKNGTYTTNQPITVEYAGVSGQPITITAETIGGVEITGTHGFNVTGSAAYLIISGFKFTHAAGTAIIDEGTSKVRFTRNLFLCPDEGAYLSISGDDAQIDYNEFAAKKTAGNMIAVAGTGSQVARRLWIHHNYFHDLANSGKEGAQMLRLGLMSTQGQSIGNALVEYNLFAGSRGVTEMISSRSSGNTCRFNTFFDSPTSQLTLRQGNDCSVYGNYFRHTEGVRIYGDRHRIFSNYFEANSIGVAIGNGAPDPADGTANKNKRPDDCVIAFNTFVDNATAYWMSRRTSEALGATHAIFSNNLIQGGETVAQIGGPYPDAIWTGNLIWNTGKAGDIPTEGYREVDPLLTAGADGIKRPQLGSPVTAAATGSFPAITLDLDGQTRPEKKAIGADEISQAPVVAHLLSPAEVGPNARVFSKTERADHVSSSVAPSPAGLSPSGPAPAIEKPANQPAGTDKIVSATFAPMTGSL